MFCPIPIFLTRQPIIPCISTFHLGNTYLNSKAAANIAYVAFQHVGKSKINFLEGNCNCFAISWNFIRRASDAIRYFTLSRAFSITLSKSLNPSCTNKLTICVIQHTWKILPPNMSFLFITSFKILTVASVLLTLSKVIVHTLSQAPNQAKT